MSGPAPALEHCPFCRFELAGHREEPTPRCPECGRLLDRVALAELLRRSARRKSIVSFVVLLLAFYGPYSWVFFIEYPWNSYHWSWVWMFPGLPMLLPTALVLDHRGDDLAVIIACITAPLLLLLLWRLTRRRWLALACVAAPLLFVSSILAWILWGLYLM